MDFVFQRSYRGPLKAILFDWAGTTIDYGCYAPAVVFIEVFKSKDVPISIAEARLPMGAPKKDHIRQILQIEAVQKRWQATYNQASTEADVGAMYQEFVPRQLACLTDYGDLTPGTVEAIKDARQRGLRAQSGWVDADRCPRRWRMDR